MRQMSERSTTQVIMDSLRAHVDVKKRNHNEGSTQSLSDQPATQGSSVGNLG